MVRNGAKGRVVGRDWRRPFGQGWRTRGSVSDGGRAAEDGIGIREAHWILSPVVAPLISFEGLAHRGRCPRLPVGPIRPAYFVRQFTELQKYTEPGSGRTWSAVDDPGNGEWDPP